MISPRQFTSGEHQDNAVLWGPTSLQPFAKTRLLLGENAIPGDYYLCCGGQPRARVLS